MNLVVSKVKRDYLDFHQTDTIRGIDWSVVTALIFNESVDTAVDLSLALATAAAKVPKVLYIANPQDPVLHPLFAGMSAAIYDDVSLLDDEATLNYLLDEYGETGLEVRGIEEDVTRISGFVDAVGAGESFNNPVYLQTLQASLENVTSSLALVDKTNSGMLQVFGQTSDILDTLQQKHRCMDEEISRLRKNLDFAKTMAAGATHSGITMYPEYSIPFGVRSCLHVKAYSPCMYLGSLLYFYRLYLKDRLGKNVRLLFIIGKGSMTQKRYSDFPVLRADQVPTGDMLRANVFVTSDPQASVLNAFFTMPADIHIVYDISYGAPIIVGSKVVQLGAVSSLRDIGRFGLKASSVFLPVVGSRDTLNIKRIQNFGYEERDSEVVPRTEHQRASSYYNACGQTLYHRLNNLLGIVSE